MKKFVALALGLVLVAALAAGCGKSTPSEPQDLGSGSTATPTAEDIAQVNAEVSANTPYVEEDVYEGTDPARLDAADGALAAVRPLSWWRTIRSVTRRFDTQYLDPDSAGRPTTAVVTVHKRLQGSFNVLVGDSLATPDSLLRKPLDDRWVRRLLLKRVRVDSTGQVRWRLAGTSGVEVTSDGAVTNIQSVRVQAGGLDTTITDPLQMHRMRRVLHIPAGTEVRVTVQTGAPDDLVLFYRWMHRARFHNEGNGAYTYRWMSGGEGGLRHFGVNALSRGTLFDDAAPYDSNAWMFAFVVFDSDDGLAR